MSCLIEVDAIVVKEKANRIIETITKARENLDLEAKKMPWWSFTRWFFNKNILEWETFEAAKQLLILADCSIEHGDGKMKIGQNEAYMISDQKNSSLWIFTV